MLDNKGFDLWANGYDISVGRADEDDEYPFAGYKDVLNTIYSKVLERGGGRVLDIGFGTGTLTWKLYEAGCEIWGQDFSEVMLRIARERMPDAHFFVGDFSLKLVPELRERKYDAIIATYSLHHLSDEAKPEFINSLLPLLSEHGRIYVGDVAFPTREALERCREDAGEEWDDEEFYFVYEEVKRSFPRCRYRQLSHCAGVFEFR